MAQKMSSVNVLLNIYSPIPERSEQEDKEQEVKQVVSQHLEPALRIAQVIPAGNYALEGARPAGGANYAAVAL